LCATRRITCCDVPNFSKWVEGEQGGDFYLDYADPKNVMWTFFVKATRVHLRSTNIVELLLLSVWESGSWHLEKPEYLRGLGFFDIAEGAYRIEDDSSSADIWYSVINVENDVANRLRRASNGNSDDIRIAWKRYR